MLLDEDDDGGGGASRGRAVRVDSIKTRAESAWIYALETEI